jgi:hypothetical protein
MMRKRNILDETFSCLGKIRLLWMGSGRGEARLGWGVEGAGGGRERGAWLATGLLTFQINEIFSQFVQKHCCVRASKSVREGGSSLKAEREEEEREGRRSSPREA